MIQFKKAFCVFIMSIFTVSCGSNKKENSAAPIQGPIQPPAPASYPYQANDLKIETRDSLEVTWGQQTSINFYLSGQSNGQVNWTIGEKGLPQGLNLTQYQGTSATISGLPAFSGQWCFFLTAKDSSSEATSEFCLNGLNNTGYPDSPQVEETPSLEMGDAVVGLWFRQEWRVEQAARATLVGDTLPPGLGIFRNGDTIVLKGYPSLAGFYIVTVNIYNYYGNVTTVQLSVTVIEGNFNNCPQGYNFNQNIGSCRPPVGTNCPVGTFYQFNNCVNYPQPPAGTNCYGGTFFDSFLDQCVDIDFPRCPRGTMFDEWYGRCLAIKPWKRPGFRSRDRECRKGDRKCRPKINFPRECRKGKKNCSKRRKKNDFFDREYGNYRDQQENEREYRRDRDDRNERDRRRNNDNRRDSEDRNDRRNPNDRQLDCFGKDRNKPECRRYRN